MAIDLTAVTLAELRYIVAAADHRHFGRAARACSVTQPTLSAQIQKLERTLRLKIFERTSKSVHVTPVGAEIVEQARAVLDATAKIVDLAQRNSEPLSGALRLGVIPTLGPYLLPWLVPPLRAAYPRLELILRELKTADLVDELAHHRLDCAMLAWPVSAAGLVAEPLFEEPFWVVVPAGHALAKKQHVDERSLKGERVLLLDEGHCMREQALEICGEEESNSAFPGDFRATSIEMLRHMVAMGMGITLLPALALSAQKGTEPDVVAIAFRAPAPARHIALCWRATHPRGADYQMLAEFVRASLPHGVERAKGSTTKRR